MNAKYLDHKTTVLYLVIVYTIFALLVGACNWGTHPDPYTGQPVQADVYDVIAAAFGWGSWEEMTDGQSAAFVALPNGEIIAASVPDAYMVGAVGDKMLAELRDVAANDHILEGEMYAARLRSSLYAIQEGFRGNPFAQMYKDPTGRWLAVYLPQGGRWFYGFVDLQKSTMYQFCQNLQTCGSFINAKSASDLSQYMKGLGWTATTASQIPGSIRNLFLHRMDWLTRALAIRLHGVIASPILVPAGLIVNPANVLYPEYGDGEVH